MIIYKIINKINNKIYIGKSLENNPNYFGSGLSINNAIKKYGKHNFEKVIIETCENESILNDREKYWIEKLNTTNRKIGYNIAQGGNGGNTRLGYGEEELNKYYNKLSSSVQNSEKYKKSVEMKRGKKRPEHSIKMKDLYRTGKIIPWNIGVETKEETKLKISKKNLGKKLSEEAKNKISESKYVGVVMMDKENNAITEFDSIKSASLKMNINRCCISDCINGRQKTAGGYKWKFV